MTARTGDIAIVGAGVAGLAAAAAFAREGRRVTVFEAAPEPRPVGAGLLLQPGGLAALARLGAAAAVEARSEAILRLEGRTASGTLAFAVDYAWRSAEARGLGVHRAVLFDALYQAARQAGAAFRFDMRVDAVAGGEGSLRLVHAAGEEGPFGFVIDGAGARSPLRPSAAKVKVYPYAALWGVRPAMADAPCGLLAQRYAGAQRMAGILPLGTPFGDGVRRAAYFWSLRADAYDSWKEKGVPAWHDEIAALWPEAAEGFAQFEDADALVFARYAEARTPRFHESGVLHIGDAAHASSPQLGQGANMALLDAVAAADAFARVALGDARARDEAVRRFERARRRHLDFYGFASRALTPFFQSDSAALGAMRDALFPLFTRFGLTRRLMASVLAGARTGLFSEMRAEGVNSPDPRP